jgi:hypothetical protein
MLCHPTSSTPTKADPPAQPGASSSRHSNEPTQLEQPRLATGTETGYTNHQTTCTATPPTQSTASFKIQHQQYKSSYNQQNRHCKCFQYTQCHESITFPILPNPLTPIAGHFEQDFFVADSTINTNYAEPPEDANKIKEMEK